jgi:hypothetical protein
MDRRTTSFAIGRKPYQVQDQSLSDYELLSTLLPPTQGCVWQLRTGKDVCDRRSLLLHLIGDQDFFVQKQYTELF